MRIACFIPAIRAQARFHDDLLRKLDGIPLIQRAILKAQSLGGDSQSIQVLTDSEEVALIARRNNADVFWQPDLILFPHRNWTDYGGKVRKLQETLRN